MFKKGLKKRINDQAGFTLVEIAIVMVIIGLLIGGVLKGQEMIKNAKTKRIMKTAEEIRAAVTSYQDRYRVLPGDDSDPNTHTGATGLVAGDGTGQIAGAEAPDVFMHLEAAGLISGSYSTTTYPKHAFGDDYYVAWATVSGRTIHWFYFIVMPGDVARTIDNGYDDGQYDTGAIRASDGYTNNNYVTLYIEF